MLTKTRAVVFEAWSRGDHGQDGSIVIAELGFELRRIDGNNILAIRR